MHLLFSANKKLNFFFNGTMLTWLLKIVVVSPFDRALICLSDMKMALPPFMTMTGMALSKYAVW